MSSDATQGLRREGDSVPEPDDPRKPDSPTDLTKRSWFYVLRKTWREFGDDECTDVAAALTFYSVLSIFPAAIALLSVLGVVGQAERSVDTVVDVLEPLVSESTLGTVRPVLETLAESQSAGLLLVVGLLAALWSASGYVGAFGRAMNRVYEIGEGRPIWKLRPLQVLITVVCILLLAVALVILAISGPLAESIGDVVGVGDAVVTIWGIAKWPVLAFVAVVIVALLYYSTPNVKQPRFRWLSVGAVAALVIWALASVVFSFYVANFGSYNKTYGSLAGVVLALLFLWIGNLALLFGAELDSELERGRELQAGMVAEEELQLPARDTRNIEKARKTQAKDIALGRRIREQSDTVWQSDGRGRGSGADSKAGASARQNADATGRHKENS
jgi:membrane protein